MHWWTLSSTCSSMKTLLAQRKHQGCWRSAIAWKSRKTCPMMRTERVHMPKYETATLDDAVYNDVTTWDHQIVSSTYNAHMLCHLYFQRDQHNNIIDSLISRRNNINQYVLTAIYVITTTMTTIHAVKDNANGKSRRSICSSTLGKQLANSSSHTLVLHCSTQLSML